MTDTITIIGNLAAEPDQRMTTAGAAVTNFRVGSTHRRFDKASNQWVDQFTNWYQVSAYRALGENVFASLHKGDRVIVTGRLRLREWDNGTKRGLAVELDADAVGHDLLWGSTTFQKAAGPRPVAALAPDSSSPGAMSTDASYSPEGEVGLETPAAATDAGGWAIPAAPAASPELVDKPF